MDRFTRIFRLHQILATHRHPVSHTVLQKKLECTRATVNRVIRAMRLYFNAPIEYDRGHNGYHYSKTEGHPYELPGLWLTPSELYALLASEQLLAEAQPGLLDDVIAPVKSRIEHILAAEHLGSGEVAKRVRILRMAGRATDNERFRTVAGALLQRQRLGIRYHGRGRDQTTEREISPQRLVHYRDNWYLDAWCHKAKALRTFALERIVDAAQRGAAARNVVERELNAYFTRSYGIFSGHPGHTAVLRFTAERARWVAEEQWHPQQEGRFLESGSYELRVPYSDARELVMDVLRHGPDVEVLGPAELRREVASRLREALERYPEMRNLSGEGPVND
ncbi:MAG: YafY family transcriptional regulator [Betaproteobacteria bacterium]|nr:YafY family transcriptional regulator [Betaproteobacteria bacterium]